MAMTCRYNIKRDSIILDTINNLVPPDHMVRKLEKAVDWKFIYPLVKDLYSSEGRPSVDPVVLFKMIFINFCFGINSMRKTCREIEVNLAYRWFIGYEMTEDIPNYSTWSQNYIRRYGNSEIFEQIFSRILQEALDSGFVDLETVFGDGTHVKCKCKQKESIQVKK